jgi:hypothetical protein
MRSRIVRPREMRETFRTEVGEFPYAFVLPAHGAGWEGKVLSPGSPGPEGPAAAPKPPVYIEIKARA